MEERGPRLKYYSFSSSFFPIGFAQSLPHSASLRACPIRLRSGQVLSVVEGANRRPLAGNPKREIPNPKQCQRVRNDIPGFVWRARPKRTGVNLRFRSASQKASGRIFVAALRR